GTHAGVHPDLVGAVRAVLLGGRAVAAPGTDLPAAAGAAQRLRRRLLGAADDRPARRALGAATASRARRARARAARQRAGPEAPAPQRLGPRVHRPRQGVARVRAAAAEAVAVPRVAAVRRMGRGTPGARRLVGRHPAAVGLLADGTARAG